MSKSVFVPAVSDSMSSHFKNNCVKNNNKPQKCRSITLVADNRPINYFLIFEIVFQRTVVKPDWND